MNVSLVGLAMFLHIGFVLAGFMIAGVLHLALNVLPRLQTTAQMRPWAAALHRLEPLLPVTAVFILAFGAWLVHLEADDGASWSAAWVLVPLVTLIIIEGVSGAILAPRSKALVERIREAPDGVADADLRRACLDPVIWDLAHIATFGFLGIVFVMADHPAGSVAWLFPVVGALVGVVASRLQTRTLIRTLGAETASATPPARSEAELPTA